MNGIPPTLEELERTRKKLPPAAGWFLQHGKRSCAALIEPLPGLGSPPWPPEPYGSTIRHLEFVVERFRVGEGPTVYAWVYNGPVLLDDLPFSD